MRTKSLFRELANTFSDRLDQKIKSSKVFGESYDVLAYDKDRAIFLSHKTGALYEYVEELGEGSINRLDFDGIELAERTKTVCKNLVESSIEGKDLTPHLGEYKRLINENIFLYRLPMQGVFPLSESARKKVFNRLTQDKLFVEYLTSLGDSVKHGRSLMVEAMPFIGLRAKDKMIKFFKDQIGLTYEQSRILTYNLLNMGLGQNLRERFTFKNLNSAISNQLPTDKARKLTYNILETIAEVMVNEAKEMTGKAPEAKKTYELTDKDKVPNTKPGDKVTVSDDGKTIEVNDPKDPTKKIKVPANSITVESKKSELESDEDFDDSIDDITDVDEDIEVESEDPEEVVEDELSDSQKALELLNNIIDQKKEESGKDKATKTEIEQLEDTIELLDDYIANDEKVKEEEAKEVEEAEKEAAKEIEKEEEKKAKDADKESEEDEESKKDKKVNKESEDVEVVDVDKELEDSNDDDVIPEDLEDFGDVDSVERFESGVPEDEFSEDIPDISDDFDDTPDDDSGEYEGLDRVPDMPSEDEDAEMSEDGSVKESFSYDPDIDPDDVESFEDKVHRLASEAYDYFQSMNIIPDNEDTVKFIVGEILEDSQGDWDDTFSEVEKVLGVSVEDSDDGPIEITEPNPDEKGEQLLKEDPGANTDLVELVTGPMAENKLKETSMKGLNKASALAKETAELDIPEGDMPEAEREYMPISSSKTSVKSTAPVVLEEDSIESEDVNPAQDSIGIYVGDTYMFENDEIDDIVMKSSIPEGTYSVVKLLDDGDTVVLVDEDGTQFKVKSLDLDVFEPGIAPVTDIEIGHTFEIKYKSEPKVLDTDGNILEPGLYIVEKVNKNDSTANFKLVDEKTGEISEDQYTVKFSQFAGFIPVETELNDPDIEDDVDPEFKPELGPDSIVDDVPVSEDDDEHDFPKKSTKKDEEDDEEFNEVLELAKLFNETYDEIINEDKDVTFQVSVDKKGNPSVKVLDQEDENITDDYFEDVSMLEPDEELIDTEDILPSPEELALPVPDDVEPGVEPEVVDDTATGTGSELELPDGPAPPIVDLETPPVTNSEVAPAPTPEVQAPIATEPLPEVTGEDEFALPEGNLDTDTPISMLNALQASISELKSDVAEVKEKVDNPTPSPSPIAEEVPAEKPTFDIGLEESEVESPEVELQYDGELPPELDIMPSDESIQDLEDEGISTEGIIESEDSDNDNIELQLSEPTDLEVTEDTLAGDIEELEDTETIPDFEEDPNSENIEDELAVSDLDSIPEEERPQYEGKLAADKDAQAMLEKLESAKDSLLNVKDDDMSAEKGYQSNSELDMYLGLLNSLITRLTDEPDEFIKDQVRTFIRDNIETEVVEGEDIPDRMDFSKLQLTPDHVPTQKPVDNAEALEDFHEQDPDDAKKAVPKSKKKSKKSEK
jgi:hypothetical protein